MWSLAFFKHFDYDDITELIEGAKSHKELRAEELSELYSQAEGDFELSKNQEYKESVLVGLQNEHYCLEESVELSLRLAIVALYIKMELRIKAICRLAFPELNVAALYIVHDLKKKLEQQGVNIKDLASYASFDEVRCINNAIKHGGSVRGKLAKYSGWTLGEELKDIGDAYSRLAPGCASFISELVDAIMRNNNEV
jgi:hypothetical protein